MVCLLLIAHCLLTSAVVKPTNEANYKNIVAVLDEVLINRLRHYSFVDISTVKRRG
jgi:hypothetical protein